jgi:hypothetical protein
MIKEYFVVANYVASIPADKDIQEFILSEIERELRNIEPDNLKAYLHGLFSVVEGDEISLEDMEDMEDE